MPIKPTWPPAPNVTVGGLFLGRGRGVRVVRFIRAQACLLPTGRHAWGDGSLLSYILAWRANASGPRPCGCVYEYAKVAA